MNGGQSGPSSKLLAAILGILGAVAVVLVVAIVVVNFNSENDASDDTAEVIVDNDAMDNPVPNDDETEPETSEAYYQAVDDIALTTGEIEQTYARDGDLDKALKSYQEKIGEALKEGKSWAAAKYLISEVSFLDSFAEKNCEESLSVIKNADLSAYSERDIMEIYSYAKDFSEYCGDEELSEEWNQKYQEIEKEGEADNGRE